MDFWTIVNMFKAHSDGMYNIDFGVTSNQFPYHNHKSKTFKKNRRKQIMVNRKRKRK